MFHGLNEAYNPLFMQTCALFLYEHLGLESQFLIQSFLAQIFWVIISESLNHSSILDQNKF